MSITQQTAETGATMTLKAAPPLAVVGANVAGWPVPEIVQWVTLAYVVLMLLHKILQMGREAYEFWWLGKRDKKNGD